MKKKVLLVAVLLAMVMVVPSMVMASTVRIGQGSYSSGMVVSFTRILYWHVK